MRATAAISCLFWAAMRLLGADEEINVDDAAYSFSVAIKKVQFEGEDVFWNGRPHRCLKISPNSENCGRHGGRRPAHSISAISTEMAEDKEAAAQFVPQEYKDL